MKTMDDSAVACPRCKKKKAELWAWTPRPSDKTFFIYYYQCDGCTYSNRYKVLWGMVLLWLVAVLGFLFFLFKPLSAWLELDDPSRGTMKFVTILSVLPIMVLIYLIGREKLPKIMLW